MNKSSHLTGYNAVLGFHASFPPVGGLWTFAKKFMELEIVNIVSGFIGGVAALLGSFLVAYVQHRWATSENEKQRAHDLRLNAAKEKHDKDMQRRAQNINKTGVASMREIGGG